MRLTDCTMFWDLGLQASAFVLFPHILAACRAAAVLREETGVDAVELFDRAALRYIE